MNQWAFKHSARNRPSKASMNALSVGFPGLEKSSATPLVYVPGATATQSHGAVNVLNRYLNFLAARNGTHIDLSPWNRIACD
jgi:hypothetical protein